MGTNLPKNPGDALEWILNRADRWQAHAAELGLSEQAAADMLALAETARAARLNAQRQRAIARGATEAWNAAIGEAMDAAGAIVSTVKATAQTEEQSGGPPAGGRVYTLALLSPPSPRRRLGPRPGTPTRLDARLLGSGALGLAFRCEHPPGARGVVYEIYRQDAPERPFEFLATTGVKRFVDRTIPPGTARVVYQIIATRAGGGRASRGDPAVFPVPFSEVPVERASEGSRAA